MQGPVGRGESHNLGARSCYMLQFLNMAGRRQRGESHHLGNDERICYNMPVGRAFAGDSQHLAVDRFRNESPSQLWPDVHIWPLQFQLYTVSVCEIQELRSVLCPCARVSILMVGGVCIWKTQSRLCAGPCDDTLYTIRRLYMTCKTAVIIYDLCTKNRLKVLLISIKPCYERQYLFYWLIQSISHSHTYGLGKDTCHNSTCG